jgi:NTP pyrophosphatase (non-canonical NTP hydrolase)
MAKWTIKTPPPRFSFDKYQDDAATTAIYPFERGLEYLSLGLVSEAGEVAGKIAKYYRKDGKLPKEDIIDECGDVLWFISELARYLDTDLSEVADKNIKKLASRKERGMLQGNGDNR